MMKNLNDSCSLNNMVLINNFVNYLMTSKNINIFWNLGSLLGFIFILQIMSGLFLVLGFSNDSFNSFNSIMFIMFEMKFGWFFRLMHMNLVSFFFFILFLHIFKGLFFQSYKLYKVWNLGVLILLMIMLESFLGYVLIWSQMSFWACTVITSLLMIIPFFGFKIVFWIWSNYYVSLLTLKLFFLLHFFLPLFIFIFIFFHLFFLHNYLSTSKMYLYNNIDKIMFFPYFWLKDMYNFLFLFLFFNFMFFKPYLFNDSEMFLEMNHLVSPIHIVPEWYFLFAYDILRSIPNKTLGVFLLMMSIFLLFLFSFNNKKTQMFNKIKSIFVFYFIFLSMMLSWLGACLVEYPFIFTGFIMSIFYFKMIFLMKMLYYIYSKKDLNFSNLSF